jgi:hypothetical protein
MRAICLEAMSVNSAYHAPVLAAEVTELLRHSRRVLDGTLGGGGHTAALLDVGVDYVVGVPFGRIMRRSTSRLRSTG